MTKKLVRTAMGKTIDMGALILQNENVRAVGNMGVNARGDVIDSTDQVIEQKNKQVQRMYKKQSQHVVKDLPVHRTSLEAKESRDPKPVDEQTFLKTLNEPANQFVTPNNAGGLATAMERAKQQQDNSND
jgi:hypothetical protein